MAAPTLSKSKYMAGCQCSASAAFAALTAGLTPAPERDRLRAALRAYCARDTLALVQVHQALREMTRHEKRDYEEGSA